METITIPLLEYQTLLEQKERIKLLEERVNKLTQQADELLAENKALKNNIAKLTQQLHGKKKDQIKANKKPPVTNYTQPNNNTEPLTRGRKPINHAALNIDEINNYDFVSTPKCSDCNKEMEHMGSNDSYHDDYKVIVKKIKISENKYVCRCCNNIVVAKGSKLPIRKGLPLPGLLTQTILDKFSNAVPCYRQSKNYRFSEISYSKQLICDWFMKSADLVSPLLSLIFNKIENSRYIAGDETPITLLNIEGKKSSGKAYVCILKQHGNKFNFVYCWVIKSRKQQIISNKLANFKGYLQTDGLNFYFDIQDQAGVVAVCCWAHVRRKFVSIVKLSDNNPNGVAFIVVEKITKLYEIERIGKNLSLEELLQLRQEKAVPILNELKIYLEEQSKNAPAKSDLGIAIEYTLTRWKELNVYTTDPQIDIDNNHTERCIKHIVIGRKNWLFAHNINSANKLAGLYSLVISCKINNINPRTYLEYIFTQLPYVNKNNITELEQLLPDRFNLDKRFDLEYLKNKGISLTTIIPPIEKENLARGSPKAA